MAFSKADSFQETEIKLAAYAKALSHPARIAILQLLSRKQNCICGDIVAELPLSQSTVSQIFLLLLQNNSVSKSSQFFEAQHNSDN